MWDAQPVSASACVAPLCDNSADGVGLPVPPLLRLSAS